MGSIKNNFQNKKKFNLTCEDDYSYIYRRKTLWEMTRLSFAIMGIEFTYAALTAFVSPVLLELGISYQQMTMVWAISPIIGFFLSPAMGSFSDRCRMKLGRRRPFILVFAVANVIGLSLIPYGESLAAVVKVAILKDDMNSNTTSTNQIEIFRMIEPSSLVHSIAVCITVFGVVIADYTSDALQNPSRAYLLDVCRTDDQARGLTTFTVLAGCGGFIGYLLGSVDWTNIKIFDNIFNGTLFNGHIQAFYTITAILFTICIIVTVTTFKEMPLQLIEYVKYQSDVVFENGDSGVQKELKEIIPINCETNSYGCSNKKPSVKEKSKPKLIDYLKSILFMPYSLWILCLTNLFCWMAHSSYSLYFTDFVGQAVFNGDPSAEVGSGARILYEDGVRFACVGMAIYSLSCMCYSFAIESLIKYFGFKSVYVSSILIDSASLMLMAVFRTKTAIIILSASCGVLYATLFTVPYILVAHYHAIDVFEVDSCGDPVPQKQIRGIGTDIAIVGSCVFVAQFILSLGMGGIVAMAGSTTAVVVTGSLLSLCGVFFATKVVYLDL